VSKEKSGCDYCSNWGATWMTPGMKRICFPCLREQRDQYFHQATLQLEEIRALEEAVASLKAQIHNPRLCDGNAAGRFVTLKGDLRQLQSTIGRILPGLEEKP